MFQDSSLDFKLVQRVCLLQQALDQAMDSLDELNQQVANHQMLQSHLAQTEEYSNVQQKIIVNLRQQLEAKDQWQHQVFTQLLLGVKRLVDDQQLELERLRMRIHQSQAEVQDYLVRLKNYYQSLAANRPPAQDLDLASEVRIVRTLAVSLSSQLQAAQQHIQQLDSTFTRHQVTFARMQAHVKAIDSPAALAATAVDPEAPASTAIEPDQDSVALQAIIQAQQQKLAELSMELEQQFHQHTHVKYRYQEAAAERDWLKEQEMTLRLENESLRAQLLQQANQPSQESSTIATWQPQWSETSAPAEAGWPLSSNPLTRFKPGMS